MKKIIVFLFIIFLIPGLFLTSAQEKNLELVIKETKCVVEEDKLLIRYSVVNKRNFDRNNVSIAFKLESGNVPVACKEIKTTIPKGADGSNIEKVSFNITCKGKPLKLKSRIFYSTKRYRIDEWFSGCKQF